MSQFPSATNPGSTIESHSQDISATQDSLLLSTDASHAQERFFPTELEIQEIIGGVNSQGQSQGSFNSDEFPWNGRYKAKITRGPS